MVCRFVAVFGFIVAVNPAMAGSQPADALNDSSAPPLSSPDVPCRPLPNEQPTWGQSLTTVIAESANGQFAAVKTVQWWENTGFVEVTCQIWDLTSSKKLEHLQAYAMAMDPSFTQRWAKLIADRKLQPSTPDPIAVQRRLNGTFRLKTKPPQDLKLLGQGKTAVAIVNVKGAERRIPVAMHERADAPRILSAYQLKKSLVAVVVARVRGKGTTVNRQHGLLMIPQ